MPESRKRRRVGRVYHHCRGLSEVFVTVTIADPPIGRIHKSSIEGIVRQPGCAVICNLMNTHTPIGRIHTSSIEGIVRQPGCAVMCNLMNTHTHADDIGERSAGETEPANPPQDTNIVVDLGEQMGRRDVMG